MHFPYAGCILAFRLIVFKSEIKGGTLMQVNGQKKKSKSSL